MQRSIHLDHPRVHLFNKDTGELTRSLSVSQGKALVRGLSDELAPALTEMTEIIFADDELWECIREDHAQGGRALPKNPSDAADKLGVWAMMNEPKERHYDYRYRKIVQAQVIAGMRTLAAQDTIVRRLYAEAVQLDNPDDLVGKAPSIVPDNPVLARNLARMMRKYRSKTGSWPAGLREVIQCPELSPRINVAFTDRQLHTRSIVRTDDGGLIYRLLLKLMDSSWVMFERAIPSEYVEMYKLDSTSALSAPLLWSDDRGEIRMRVSIEVEEPERSEDPPVRVLAGDWNVDPKGIMVFTLLERAGERVDAGADAYYYAPEHLQGKIERLWTERGSLVKKIAQYKKLLNGKRKSAAVQRKLAVLERELKFVDKSRRDISQRMADDCARHIERLARELDVDMVVIEDLASYQVSRGIFAAATNMRLSQSPRGEIRTRIMEVLEGTHVRTKTVMAAYTSQKCPHCGEQNTHKRKKVTHPTHRESVCGTCGNRGHRDEWASLAIGLRALRTRKISQIGGVSVPTRRVRANHHAKQERRSHSIIPASHWRIVSLRAHSTEVGQGEKQAGCDLATNHHDSARIITPA